MRRSISFSFLTRAVGLLGLSGLLALPAQAQTPTWAWAMHAYCTQPGKTVTIKQTVTTAAGDSYISGEATGEMMLGTTLVPLPAAIPMPPTGLPESPQRYAFFARLDPAGAVQWVKTTGGRNVTVTGISIDGAGSIYVLGRFYTVARFGTLNIQTPFAIHAQATDGYLAKLSPQGQWLWAEQTLGTSNVNNPVNFAYLTSDASGNVFVTGTGGGSFNNNVNVSTTGVFVARCDANGQFQWATGSTGTSVVAAVAADAAGDVYLTGKIRNGSTSFGTTTLNPLGGSDAFVAKLSGATGQWQWATALGGPANDEGVAVATANGQVIAGATIQGSTNIGTAGSGTDAATARLDAASGLLLLGSATGSTAASARAVALSSDGYALTGYTSSAAAFFQAQPLPSAGGLDGYLGGELATGTGGVITWALAIGGSDDEIITAVSAPTAGTALMAGTFTSPSLTFGSTTLTNAGGTDAFVARLGTPLGVADEVLARTLSLAPNPARGGARLTLSADPATPRTADLLDAVGRVVRTYPVAGRAAWLDLNGLPAGLYLVRCGAAARRLVVE